MTRSQFTPRPHQPGAMDFLVSNPRGNLWAGMGMGKTSIVSTVLEFMYNTWGDSAPTLVLGPLRVARDTWSREVEKWEHLRGLEVTTVTGTVAERTAALRRDVPVVVMNYDNLVWLRDHLKSTGRAWPFARVVADEATRLKGFRLRQGTVRAQALAQFAHKDVKSWWNLTGTPAPNGLRDLWGQQWFVDQGARLGRTFSAFEKRWFAMQPHHPGAQYGSLIAMPHAQDEIHAKLADCSLTVDPKDWFDLRDPIVNVIEVDLPKDARMKYRALEKELFAQLDSGEEIEVFNAAALSNKCMQFANGAAYLDPERYGPDAWGAVHDAKLEALESLVEEQAGAALIVAYNFRSDRERILKAFPKAVDLATEEGLAEFRDGRAQIGLGHPQSIGHGIDGLQNVCNAICFFGLTWNLELQMQIIERIGPVRQMQAGLDRPCFVHYIVARDTVDDVVLARLQNKGEVQALLLNYMKGKR